MNKELTLEKFPWCCGYGILTGLNGLNFEALKVKILQGKHYGYQIWMDQGEWKSTNYDVKVTQEAYPYPKKGHCGTGWGSILVITSPSQTTQEAMLKAIGFEEIAKSNNPVYGVSNHYAKLWHINLNKVTDKQILEAKFDPNTI